MLRKVGALLLLLLSISAALCSGKEIERYIYPKYLNDDVRYVNIFHEGAFGMYLKLDSIRVTGQDNESISISVEHACALVSHEDIKYNLPVKRYLEKTEYLRRYKDPWNIIYVRNNNGSEWYEEDITKTGKFPHKRIAFATVWYIATGMVYPHLESYIRYDIIPK